MVHTAVPVKWFSSLATACYVVATGTVAAGERGELLTLTTCLLQAADQPNVGLLSLRCTELLSVGLTSHDSLDCRYGPETLCLFIGSSLKCC